MNNKWFKLSSVLVLGAYLAACGDAGEEDTADEDTELVEEDEDVEETEEHDDEDHDDEDHDHDDEDHDHEEDDHDHGHGDDEDDAPEIVEIEGVEDHYHTGELVELTAILDEDEDVDYDDWHWYIREDEDAEWEMVSEQNTDQFVDEAPEESFEIRAVLYDDAHDAYVQSPATEIEVDNH